MTAFESRWALIFPCTIIGCTAGEPSDGATRVGADGSFHPDATAGIAGYTGHGQGGEGWAGDGGGEGGPRAEPRSAADFIAR